MGCPAGMTPAPQGGCIETTISVSTTDLMGGQLSNQIGIGNQGFMRGGKASVRTGSRGGKRFGGGGIAKKNGYRKHGNVRRGTPTKKNTRRKMSGGRTRAMKR